MFPYFNSPYVQYRSATKTVVQQGSQILLECDLVFSLQCYLFSSVTESYCTSLWK